MKFKSLVFTFACLLCVAWNAQSAVISTTEYNYGSTPGSATLNADQFVFEWSGTPIALGLIFESDTAFTLSLDAFVSNGSFSDVTGFTLDVISGGIYTRLTTDTDFCDSATGDIAGDCNLISLTGASGGSTKDAFQPGEFLFLNLAAGQYLLGLYDSASPSAGTATFGYTKVSAPASGLLLTLGFVALAMRRRK